MGIGAGVMGAAQLTATFVDLGTGATIKQIEAQQAAADAAMKQAEANYLFGMAEMKKAESSAAIGTQFLQTSLQQEQLRQAKSGKSNMLGYALAIAALIAVVFIVKR